MLLFWCCFLSWWTMKFLERLRQLLGSYDAVVKQSADSQHATIRQSSIVIKSGAIRKPFKTFHSFYRIHSKKFEQKSEWLTHSAPPTTNNTTNTSNLSILPSSLSSFIYRIRTQYSALKSWGSKWHSLQPFHSKDLTRLKNLHNCKHQL